MATLIENIDENSRTANHNHHQDYMQRVNSITLRCLWWPAWFVSKNRYCTTTSRWFIKYRGVKDLIRGIVGRLQQSSDQLQEDIAVLKENHQVCDSLPIN